MAKLRLLDAIVMYTICGGKFYMTLANGRTYRITKRTYFWLASREEC